MENFISSNESIIVEASLQSIIGLDNDYKPIQINIPGCNAFWWFHVVIPNHPLIGLIYNGERYAFGYLTGYNQFRSGSNFYEKYERFEQERFVVKLTMKDKLMLNKLIER